MHLCFLKTNSNTNIISFVKTNSNSIKIQIVNVNSNLNKNIFVKTTQYKNVRKLLVMINKSISKEVEGILKLYKALRVVVKNRRELLEHGVPHLFNKLMDTEAKTNSMYQAIYDAINKLNDKERIIIENRYLVSEIKNDSDVYQELGFNKEQYYKHKNQVIKKLYDWVKNSPPLQK